jgi:hypothetical protein
MLEDVLTFRHTIRAPSSGRIVRRGWYYGPNFREKPYDVRPMAAPIPYAPPISWHRRRRTQTLILRLVIVAALLCGGAWLFRFGQQLQFLAQQREWMNFSMPPDKIVLAEGTPDVPTLLTKSDYRNLPHPPISDWPAAPTAASNMPQSLAPLGAPGAWVFVHGLHGPGQDERLVSVSLVGEYGWFVLRADALVPAALTLGSRPAPCPNFGTSETMRFDAQKPLRVFAGQPDPADGRHFTIRYDLDGKSNTIDGWLMPDDTVQLQPRG